jgi:hypothetical protein
MVSLTVSRVLLGNHEPFVMAPFEISGITTPGAMVTGPRAVMDQTCWLTVPNDWPDTHSRVAPTDDDECGRLSIPSGGPPPPPASE